MAVKFIVKNKIPKDSWVSTPQGDRVPAEIATLAHLSHPNIINFIEYIMDKDYLLMITELHGSSWDIGNPELHANRATGLKIGKTFSSNKQEPIRKKTSCDLFECIDARILS